MEDYSWSEKRYLRSVDQLKLWNENPRLNPMEEHRTLKDFAEDLTTDQSDKQALFDLAKSIVDKGFLQFEPIVVWQGDDNRFYVAEGNRRVLVLKLLRHPEQAPRSVRAFFRKLAQDFNANSVEKINVIVAPSFENAEWYINQRNSLSSLARPWSRLQQQRWIYNQYKKYQGNYEILKEKTGLTPSELDTIIRTLKIRDFINTPKVMTLLREDEIKEANSHKFPMTVLERFFESSLVREQWGINVDGSKVKITSDEDSFAVAYADLIKSILGHTDIKIDTRTITNNLSEIINMLPSVKVGEIEWEIDPQYFKEPLSDTSQQVSSNTNTAARQKDLKGDPNRKRVILPIYEINTDSYRMQSLFEELKHIPFRYTACIAAAMRVFLDLSILKYIDSEGIRSDICKEYNTDLRKIILNTRLEYIKKHCKLSTQSKNIIGKLLNPYELYSLDILNGFVHSEISTPYLNRQYLNGFWDFLLPLYKEILDVKEKDA